MNSRIFIIVLACLFTSPAWCVNGPWSMSLPAGTTATLNAVASKGAVDVAVGANGVLLNSVDGTHWTRVTTGYESLSDNLVSVTWASDKFYAVGDHGLVLVSADGTTWAGQFPLSWGLVSQHVSGFSGIAAGNNLVAAALGPATQSLATGDGATWAMAPNSSVGFNASKNIVWGPGSFYGISGTTIQSSSDGVTGTAVVGYPGSQACDIASNGTTLIVQDITGYFYTTTDGVNWSSPGPHTSIGCYVSSGLRWTGHDFVWFNTYAPNSYYISADGLNWTAYTTPAGYVFKDMIWDGVKYIAVGTFGTVLTSPNGAAWTQVSGPDDAAALNSPALNSAVQFIVWDGSQFIAATYSSVMVGSGTSWQTASLPQELFFLTFVNDKTYAVNGEETQTLYSTDGIHWNTTTLTGFDSISGDGTSQVVAWLGENSSSQLAISGDDGVTWSVQSEGISPPRKLIRAQGRYVGVNETGVLWSTDGTNWNIVGLVSNGSPAPGGPALDDVVYGNGMFVVLANTGSVFTSPDAANWTTHSLSFAGTDNPVNLSKVVWDGSEFLALGGTGLPSDPAIYDDNVWVSADGVAWYPEVLPPGMSVTAISAGSGQALIGGRNGDLATAVPNLRGIPSVSDVSITATSVTPQTVNVPQILGSFSAMDPQGLPLSYIVGGESGIVAGSFVVTVADQKSGKFLVTTVEDPTAASSFQYVVSNDVVYSATGTVHIAVIPTPPAGGGSGGSGGGNGANKSGGGASGWLSLLTLLAVGIFRKFTYPPGTGRTSSPPSWRR